MDWILPIIIFGSIYLILSDGALFRQKPKKTLRDIKRKKISESISTIDSRVQAIEGNGRLTVVKVKEEINTLNFAIDELMQNKNLLVNQLTELKALKLRLSRFERRITEPKRKEIKDNSKS